MPNSSHLFEALKHEDAQINGRMQEIYKSLYAILGVALPGAVAVFVFLAREHDSVQNEVIAFAFITVFTLASLWANNLWMELFPFIRYKYLVLQPQLFEATGQGNRANLVTFVSPRPFISWVPTLLFSLLTLLTLAGVWLLLIPRGTLIWWASLLFVLAAFSGSASVVTVARRTERELVVKSHAASSGASLRRQH